MNNSVDMREFQRALRDVQNLSRKTPAEQCNQRAMNVSRRMVETLPPTDVPEARKRVKRYMDEFVRFTRVKRNKSGKNKGRYRPFKKSSQLRRKHLIAQARNAALGKKGLYGEAMKKASGKLSAMAQISQGFLKSVFLPVITGLYSVVKYRPPVRLTRYIARWPGSAGFGKIKPARAGLNPTALMQIGVTVKPDQTGKVQSLYAMHFNRNIAAETAEMKAHYERTLQRELDRLAA